MDKKFWTEDIGLKGYKWSDKLRIYWLVLSLLALGCVADAPWWLPVLLLGNFAASAISLGKVEFKDDGKI
jgi:hypothetical protein